MGKGREMRIGGGSWVWEGDRDREKMEIGRYLRWRELGEG